MDLFDAHYIKELLTAHELSPRKDLGQHFLINPAVAHKMTDASQFTKEDVVVEVGAGLGTLTQLFAEVVKKVYAVEIDARLINLFRKLHHLSNVQLVQADILELPNHFLHQATKLIGSIPYQITSPLLHKIVYQKHSPSICVLLVQKELAEKIIAPPPCATYLSNFVQLYGSAQIISKTVKAGSFWPSPKVYSSIIKIEQASTYLKNKVRDRKRFSQFLHYGFSQPRKMLNKLFTLDELGRVHILPSQRAQELDFDRWLALYQAVLKSKAF